MITLSLFKMESTFFIYLILFHSLRSNAIPIEDKDQNDKPEAREQIEHRKDGTMVSVKDSELNNEAAKLQESNKKTLSPEGNGLKSPTGVSLVSESKMLHPLVEKNPINAPETKNNSDAKKLGTLVVEKNSSAHSVKQDIIPTLTESPLSVGSKNIESNVKNGVESAVVKPEEKTAVTSNKKLELPPHLSKNESNSVTSQKKEDGSNIGANIIKDPGYTEPKKTFDNFNLYHSTEEDEDVEKGVDLPPANKKENVFDSNPSYGIIENDQSNNYNDNSIMKDVVNPVRTVFPNKNGVLYDDTNSHFFAYFLTLMVMAVLFYLLFHNKQRIIALLIEGRQGRPSRRNGARAKYHKLDNNLEEAMSSTRGVGGGEGTLGKIY